MKELYVKSSREWREWLVKNHDKSQGVWLIYYKKESGKQSLTYEPSVEEALCYGWVDSIIRRIDNEKYARKFTPRKDESNWSELNKNRVQKLIKEGRMAGPGLEKVKTARFKGTWDQPDRPDIEFKIPVEFRNALDKNTRAKKNFDHLALSYKKQYIGWISVAKRAETREKRITESIRLLENGEKLGMK
jgi:uncharacterized protein YdeI (YjbR/CyaY-like superfamily)